MIDAMPSAALAAFGHKTLDLIQGLVPISASAFALRPGTSGRTRPVLRGIDPAIDEDYRCNFSTLDPIQPPDFEGTRETVVELAAVVSPRALRQSAFYRGFMMPNGYRHVIDMFLRRNGRIVGVVSLLRNQDGPAFDRHEVTVLRQLQPFVEYALNGIDGDGVAVGREIIRQSVPFTERELDVVELVLRGSPNKIIQRELGISQATVKTHLLHIFDKAGVSSRAELIARLLRRH